MNKTGHRLAPLTARKHMDYLPLPFIGSHFSDAMWTVRTPMTSGNTLHWDTIMFRDGTTLTGAMHARLLVALKTFVTLLTSGVGLTSRSRLKGHSVLSLFSFVRSFVSWMYDRHGLRSLKHLTIAHLIAYRKYLDRRKIGGQQRGMLLCNLRYLIKLQDRIPDGPTLDAFAALRAIPWRSGDKPGAKTERIPDATFHVLMNEALRWVEDIGPQLVPLWHAARKYNRKGRTGTHRVFASGYAHPSIITCAKHTIDLKTLNANDLSRWFAALAGACYILIGGGIGMRNSEIRDIRKRPLSVVNAPDGVVILKLNSTLHKTSKEHEGEPATWTAGYETPENIVRKAVTLLEQMFPHGRYLFQPLGNRAKHGKMGHMSFANAMRRFSEIAGVATKTPLATPQLRKTFARCVATSNANAEMALMDHYKHQSVLMTRGYFPDDPEQLQEILEAHLEYVEERYDAILSADRLGGKGGQEILRRNAAFRGPKGAKKRKEAIQAARFDPDIRLVPHLYGACLFPVHPPNCDGKAENVGRETCAPCKNLLVLPEHLPVWEEIVEQLQNLKTEFATMGIVDLDMERQLADAIARV